MQKPRKPSTTPNEKNKPRKPLYNKAEDERREVDGNDTHAKDWRNNYTRDYGRIIHSASFRRQQGKTQVFPSRESDFFRNRLTHSLEVAQIAQGIAEQINYNCKEELGGEIDARLCATAGLVHDIGHPPFGHNGERALDDAMRKFGGFEGNAQTFRILTRLEKKERYDKPKTGDIRAGLNLCHRTLAAVLKYDRKIPAIRADGDKIAKGYYASEKEIVDSVKKSVIGDYKIPKPGKFKTIECSIMDLADDIAYSVYDLEDCLKVGFLTAAEIIASEEPLLEKVAERVSDQMELEKPIGAATVLAILVDIFASVFKPKRPAGEQSQTEEHADATQGLTEEGPSLGGDEETKSQDVSAFILAYRASRLNSEDGYDRTAFSSELVHRFISAVKLDYNAECPPLSAVYLPHDERMQQEVLKQYTYEAAIYAPRVKIGEYRGYDLVRDIFDALMSDRGGLLMPADVRERVRVAPNVAVKARDVCDFVAGMTDRYAMEFWARLKSDSAESMFKPI
ncbi:dGTP triphosphohydrolase [Mesorhizobium retamae]|uniref:Deoxyguanosinetriphosphate triphosphohydrolase-like protein n=1 Tax=Mesorhizobium retamae TaxID=2912854 RepID=A0ABS9QP49_9HYPH|nr:dNTP triphosphohydrolase [Mesorhizobium sp. IRAMC:0171]MCG7509192.1 dNTP triphosphohydrolase [Mesorhizobium sp. IRAMC:0171]